MKRKIKKKSLKQLEKARIKRTPELELKASLLSASFCQSDRERILRIWYRQHRPKYRRNLSKVARFRAVLNKRIDFLYGIKVPFKILDFIRWVTIDILRLKPRKFWGIYCYVALPGEGKTLSMVAHMERAIKEVGKDNIFIATNFGYLKEDLSINHWIDIIHASNSARFLKVPCIVAIDEIHTTFDASDWKSFPSELLSLLSFNRKFSLQFICSSQIYDRIPRKVRDISNYTVLCKNTLGLDRHFKNYYFNTLNYEASFSGKRAKADFIRTYVASDYLYSLYDTLSQVDRMTSNAAMEKDKKQEAFKLLFGCDEDVEEASR